MVAVPGVFGLPMLLVFNAIMLTSAGSTLDSTFASAAKLGARDWGNDYAPPTESHASRGRWLMVAIALFGNLPLLSIYLGDQVGPAIIAATTISGTMVMGLAPVVGVPLPLVSYGGSAMLVLLAAFGLVQSAHIHRPR